MKSFPWLLQSIETCQLSDIVALLVSTRFNLEVLVTVARLMMTTTEEEGKNEDEDGDGDEDEDGIRRRRRRSC